LQSVEKPKQFTDHIISLVKQISSNLLNWRKQYFSQQTDTHIAGIDINCDFVKLLKISVHGSQLKIDNFAVLPTPPGAIVKNEIKNPQLIAPVLKQAIAQSGLMINTVALAVNRSAAIIKSITVDNRLNRDEIESRVWIEANRLFPNLVSDIYLDFAIIGPAQEASQIEVVLIACRKEQMKPYLEIMRLTELSPSIIDVNCYAFERALSIITASQPELNTIALLNIDFSLITLIVLQNNTLIYTHELSYDGHSLSQKNKTFPPEVSMTNAHDNDALDKEDVLLSSIALHLKHSMQFFYSSRSHATIQKIVLSGDCVVYVSNLANFIENEIGIEVIVPNLFKEMIINSNIDKEKIFYHAPQLILSCGLALSKLN